MKVSLESLSSVWSRKENPVLAGPIFTREFLTAPRSSRHFLLRTVYLATLVVLMYTAGMATFFRQPANTIGEVARFGALVFALFSTVQLALMAFFAPLFAAGRVAQEKDRQTLILLLMTDLRDRELVVGKLLASLFPAAVLLLASLPVFTMVYILGGVSLEQIGWSVGLCAATGFAAGCWGSLVAFWREKTFQTLAITTIGLLLFLAVVEALVAAVGQQSAAGYGLGLLNPFRGLALVLDPLAAQPDAMIPSVPAGPYVLAMVALGVVLEGVGVVGLRLWNPPRTTYETVRSAADTATRAATRGIWHNPVLWREICTRAYGRKMAVIKLAYLLLFALAVAWVATTEQAETVSVLGLISVPGAAFVVTGFVSLLLINAQAVTSLTTERDTKTLELLLVTDLTAREFIFGKLGGVFYNTKEVLLLPILGVLSFTVLGWLSVENTIYVVVGFLVLAAFAAMLGLHSGLSFENSRTAIANSLGTMFFLFLGIFVCMLLIIEAKASFAMQLPSFILFIFGGSMGLWASLTHKNPAPALSLAAFLLPFLTFYSITSFLLGETLGVCLVLGTAYGFTAYAMLVPAISEFDVALGRSTVDRGQ